jgi:geranylgeranyl diphosphate synthase, type II
MPPVTVTFDVTPSFEESCRAFRGQIEAALDAALSRRRDGCPDRLFEAMHYSLLGGGKRLRPILVLLSCEACGGNAVDAMPAACAIEMIHTYSLIHDDLPAMDDDALRRGRPTCHMQFDEATAILAGDALLTLAFEILATEISPPETAAACCAALASAAGHCGMVGGQMADLQAEHSGVDSVQQLEGIHRRKTGRLLQGAVSLGARVAGASSAIVTSLEEYGRCIGLAFQITDDLLDVVGDEIRMGKEVRKDTQRGKLTYPALLGEAESRKKARALIDRARESLRPLGAGSRRLEALAEFVLERDH